MPAHPKISWELELTRCMRGGFGQKKTGNEMAASVLWQSVVDLTK